jgi:hypothetical protein
MRSAIGMSFSFTAEMTARQAPKTIVNYTVFRAGGQGKGFKWGLRKVPIVPNPDEPEPKIFKKGYIRQDLQDRQDCLTTKG